ncbi:MAG: hypothetical protein ABIT38_16275, partial [Gemmatimonadaceae bacterium]
MSQQKPAVHEISLARVSTTHNRSGHGLVRNQEEISCLTGRRPTAALASYVCRVETSEKVRLPHVVASLVMRPDLRKFFNSRTVRWSAVALVAVLISLVAVRATRSSRSAATERIAPLALRYSDLVREIRAQRVDSLVIDPGSAITGWVRPATDANKAREFRVEFGSRDADALVALASESDVGIAFAPRPPDRSNIVNL